MDADEEKRFRDFVDARSPALMRVAFLLTGGDQHAAEDLLQTALAKTARQWSRVEDAESYIRTALYRQQISLWRRRSRRGETVSAAPPEMSFADPSQAADRRLTVRLALARLTRRQRAVLVLRYFEDLPEAAVAEMLNISVGTVRSTAHRSLARLRKIAPELEEVNQ